MASLLEVEVIVRMDGQVLAGFPFIRRILVNQADAINYQKVADNNTTSFTTIAGSNIPAALQVFILKSDSPVNIRLNGQPANVCIPLNAGGLVVIIDETTGATAPTINNPAVSQAATIQGVAGGT